VLSHRRSGSGPPLLLLHGIGLDVNCWEPVRPILERERDVIAVDLPGFGASPPGATTVDGLADAVAAFADELGLERPHVAGNSMGGGVALALGARGRVASACAISPIGFANDREGVYARWVLATTRLAARALAPVADSLASSTVARVALCGHIAGRPARIPPAEAALWTRACAEAPSFWPLLRSAPDWTFEPTRCPTTVAWGDRDRLLIHSRQAPRARRLLPAARHVTLAGCGHVPTWDDPDAVARVILER
jgi:pimeloyl-ACP methyl ester carboxylesterase